LEASIVIHERPDHHVLNGIYSRVRRHSAVFVNVCEIIWQETAKSLLGLLWTHRFVDDLTMNVIDGLLDG
jgi:hypothetical protein